MDELELQITVPEALEFREALEANGVQYVDRTPRPKPGQILASAVEILSVAGDTAPYAIIATVIIAWVRANSKRKVTFMQKDYSHFQFDAQGYSVEEIEQLLKEARTVVMVDPRKKHEK